MRALILSPILLLLGCGLTPPPSSSTVNSNMTTQLDGPLAQLQVDSRQLFQRLLRLTADKQCRVQQDCAVMAIGRQPCGGPEQYLAYALDKTDSRLLQITQDRYAKVKLDQQQRLGTVSNCQALPMPQTLCVQNQCVLQDSSAHVSELAAAK